MSRSFKKYICHYICCGSEPSEGKRKTSRLLRRKIHSVLKKINCLSDDFYFFHNLDKNRGHKGSRDYDYGWDYFGDGFYIYFKKVKNGGVYNVGSGILKYGRK